MSRGSLRAENLAALARFEEATAKRQAAARAATKVGRAAAQGISAQTLIMRERRQRVDVKDAERRANQARDKAYRVLAKRHHDEFMVIVQEQRDVLGLPILVPRNKRQADVVRPGRTAPEVVRVPKPPEQRANCRHNMGLKKLPYGTFCNECGEKIR